MADRDLGFGLVGCGVIAPWHIAGIEAARGAKLVAVCDEQEAKAKKLGQEKQVNWYTNLAEMLKQNDLDILCLCTPSSLHPEQTIAGAKAGKHIITEKPMAVTLEKADEMINVCRQQKVKLACIFQRRVVEPFRAVKEALEKQELGKLVLGDCHLKYYRSQAYYDSAGWRGTWEFDGGGALMNQGIHMIDLLQWYLGEVETIYGWAQTLARKIEVEDTAVAVLKFKNGALGVIEGTTSVFPADIPHRLEIHGEKGSILIEGEGIKRWITGGPDGEPLEKVRPKEDAEKTKEAIVSPTSIGNLGHQIQIQDMVAAVNEDRAPLVPGLEGRKSLEIILAIYESSKSGKPIKLA